MDKKSAFVSSVAENCYFKATEFYPEVRFKYVPCLYEERAAINDQCNQTAVDSEYNSDVESFNVWRPELAKRIESWNLGLPPTEDNIRKLKHSLINRFVSVVIYGGDLGDIDPESPEEASKNLARESEGNATSAMQRIQEKN